MSLHIFNHHSGIIDIFTNQLQYRISLEGNISKLTKNDLLIIQQAILNYDFNHNFTELNKLIKKYNCIKEIYNTFIDIYPK